MVQNPGTNVPGFFHFKKRIAVPKEVRYCLAVWLKLIVLTGIEWGGAARPLTRFFFLINFAYEQNLSKILSRR